MNIKISRPALGESASVFVPVAGREKDVVSCYCIHPGSGIVGFVRQEHDTSAVLYYEGNLYGAENLVDWRDRVRNAYGRMATSYPTIAQTHADLDLFEIVGSTDGRTVSIDNQAAVDRWNAWRAPTAASKP